MCLHDVPSYHGSALPPLFRPRAAISCEPRRPRPPLNHDTMSSWRRVWETGSVSGKKSTSSSWMEKKNHQLNFFTCGWRRSTCVQVPEACDRNLVTQATFSDSNTTLFTGKKKKKIPLGALHSDILRLKPTFLFI